MNAGPSSSGASPRLDGDRLFNSVAVIGPDGRIAGTYRKLHLFGRERDVFTPGDHGLPVFEIAGLRLGVVVCYDLRFPEAVRILALRDVDLVAVPTAWVAGFDKATSPTGSIGQVDGALVQGNLNSVFLACADQVGEAEPYTFLGRSVLVDPYGQATVGPLDPVAEDLVVVEIDTDDVAGPGTGAPASPRWRTGAPMCTGSCSATATPGRPTGPRRRPPPHCNRPRSTRRSP